MSDVKNLNNDELGKVVGGIFLPEDQLLDLNRALNISKKMNNKLFRIVDSELERAINFLQNDEEFATANALFNLSNIINNFMPDSSLNDEDINKLNEIKIIFLRVAHYIDSGY